MARKKKNTRKYTPRNEFRLNKSPKAQNHYNYVFGETKTHYKSIGLTTHPKDNIPHYKLTKNPEPNNNNDSHLQLKVLNTQKRYLSSIKVGWKFSKDDMPVVRLVIKRYKKSTNRKPKLWYEKKRKLKNKKR